LKVAYQKPVTQKFDVRDVILRSGATRPGSWNWPLTTISCRG